MFANTSLEWNNEQLISLVEQVSGAPASDAFRTCVTERRHLPWLESISAAATQAGVQSTPTLFVDGTRVDIATLTPQRLTEMINAAAS